MRERDFSNDGWLRSLEPTREAKLASGASITCDDEGNATLDESQGELYFTPHEQFLSKAVVQNADGGVAIVPTTNGRPLLVLAIVDSQYGTEGGTGGVLAPPEPEDVTERALVQPKPGCCTVQ